MTISAAITIRHAGSDDLNMLAGLLDEARRHYWGDQDADAGAGVEMATALLNGQSGCKAAIATSDRRNAVGFATYTILHPAPVSAGTLFLKDLYVTAGARSLHVGQKMVHWLARLAAERGCERFDWTAEDDNPGALRFYDRLGAERVAEKIYYRISGDALRDFAAGTS